MSQTLTPTTSFATKRNAWLIAGGLGLAGVGLAAGMLLRSPSGSEPAQVVAEAEKAPVAKSTPPTAKPKAVQAPVQRAAERPPLDTQTAALCAHCGVIEGVRPVQRKGEGSGVGAVAGGVAGALVGSQMGGGSGKTAMTVIGAVGGGFAGNEIEKRSKSTTEYEVRVRMDDGSLRTFTSSTQPTPGTPVTVDDKGFRVVQGQSGNAPRTTRTSG